jgi:hypothetical protein
MAMLEGTEYCPYREEIQEDDDDDMV